MYKGPAESESPFQRTGSVATTTVSPSCCTITEFVEIAACSSDPVLLTGETGSGKTYLARRVHELSTRASGPFVQVNCAAIPDGLFEREMFGHMRGAFTDAKDSQPGFFEAAQGGTLFLDEIGELPLHVQPKLLTVLEANTVRRLGSHRELPLNVRVMVASNQDLRAMVQQRSFRADLFFRCAVLEFEVPPLRARASAIPHLVRDALSRDADARGSGQISAEALELLCAYEWPGNLRELENALRRARAFARCGEIRVEHLPADIRTPRAPANRYVGPSDSADERESIRTALRASEGNKARAARTLGMSRGTLWAKLQRYGLAVETG